LQVSKLTTRDNASECLRIAVDPLTEHRKVVRASIVGDVSERSRLELVMQRDSDVSLVAFVGRVLVIELCVIDSRSAPLEAADVY
jgi:hypothetical protein